VAHCPKCGDPFDETDGQLRCVRGSMLASYALAEMIRAGLRAPRATSSVVSPPPAGSHGEAGGAWFCPRCAAILPDTGSNLACRSCGYLLTWPQRYALLESHPHAAWPSRSARFRRLVLRWARAAAPLAAACKLLVDTWTIPTESKGKRP
jgi:hypothetical protein